MVLSLVLPLASLALVGFPGGAGLRGLVGPAPVGLVGGFGFSVDTGGADGSGLETGGGS